VRGGFGSCRRYGKEAPCGGHLLPFGQVSRLGESSVMGLCPKCRELYVPRSPSSGLDGAFFGPSPALLVLGRAVEWVGGLEENAQEHEWKAHGFRVRLKENQQVPVEFRRHRD
jgi:hypothetical protein